MVTNISVVLHNLLDCFTEPSHTVEGYVKQMKYL